MLLKAIIGILGRVLVFILMRLNNLGLSIIKWSHTLLMNSTLMFCKNFQSLKIRLGFLDTQWVVMVP